MDLRYSSIKHNMKIEVRVLGEDTENLEKRIEEIAEYIDKTKKIPLDLEGVEVVSCEVLRSRHGENEQSK